MENKKKYRSFLSRFSSIRSAIIVSFSFLLLSALLIFLVIALNYTKESIFENSIDNTKQLINQVNYDIDSYIIYMENISNMMAENNDVKSYLFDTQNNQKNRIQEKSRILSQFSTIMNTRNDIYNIAAIARNGNSIINDGKEELSDYVDILNLNWSQEALASEDGISISSSHVQNAIKSSYKWVITLTRALHNDYTNAKDGIVFIDLNYSAISDLCNNNKIGSKGYVYIIDEKGNLIYHPQQQLMYGGLKTEIINEVLECKEEYLISGKDNESKLYTMSKSKKTGWTVVGTAYTSELLKNNRQTQLLYFAVAILLLFAVIVFSGFVANSITKPVEKLRDSMVKVEQGDFARANVEITTNNEIGSLGNSFNLMTKRIEELMEQNVYEQTQKRKSELRALQSQINPHFLYNTLDSIIWMAEGKKNEEVVLMTAALAKLLRQSISNEQELVPLSQEIAYVQSYLVIQKMRYKDKLEYSIKVDPKIQFVPIIKLVLQPVVENAIYHGLKYKESRGFLNIKAYQNQEKIIVEIEDDGVGMSQETLVHIFDKHKVNYHSNGVGIYNVQQRLQLYYGKNYGLTYFSELGQGTKVIISIPADGGETHETA